MRHYLLATTCCPIIASQCRVMLDISVIVINIKNIIIILVILPVTPLDKCVTVYIQIDQNVRPKYATMQCRTAVTYRVRCYGNIHLFTSPPDNVWSPRHYLMTDDDPTCAVQQRDRVVNENSVSHDPPPPRLGKTVRLTHNRTSVRHCLGVWQYEAVRHS